MMNGTTVSSWTGSATLKGRSLPDLNALRTFLAVCEAGSMSLAAQRLGISQSAVSQSVRTLENDYGVQLFDREVRPARPTQAGEALLAMTDRLLADAHAIAQVLRHRARQDLAQIRIGCVDSFAATVGPGLVRALSGSARQLQLWSGLTPGLNAQLLARELDLAVCTEEPADTRIAQRLLFSECWVAVFPRGRGGDGFCDARALVARAEGLPLIRYSQRSVTGQQIERFVRHVGINAERRFEFDATDPLLSLVAAGLGWAISTPLCLWQSRAWLPGVTMVPIAPTRLGQRDFHLLYRESEWCHVADEVTGIARIVLRRELLPALRGVMTTLPEDAVLLQGDE